MLLAPPHEDLEVHERLHKLAKKHGLDIEGGQVRRSSSRFCFGVEHGDYNGMPLFGIGTDRFIWLAYKPNNLGSLRLVSGNFLDDGIVEIQPKDEIPASSLRHRWSRFPQGVCHILREEGYPIKQGIDAVLWGNIPGGGMSRSASLSLNLIETLLEVNGIGDVDGMTMVDLAQKVENDYIGSPCGKLDQLMIYFAKAGCGTLFDPTTNQVRHVPFGANADDFRLVSLDTGTKRPGLEKSTYKLRRTECDQLARQLQTAFGWPSLAAIQTPDDFQKATEYLKENHVFGAPRLKYLYEAHQRFASTIQAWEAGDIAQVGANFRADGYGLRDDYQISGPELETMCDLARTVDGVYGERMLGGGDKGASGALVQASAFPALQQTIETAYPLCHPTYADGFAIHACRSVNGIQVYPLD